MKNILIVDDNPQNLYMLQTLLSGHGYGVTEAANGAEALEKARSERPDMIISDILMPVMDGFELCREWKRDGRLKDVPFVFYTATYTDPKDEEFGLGLGAARFVVKPQEPEAFLGILEEVFEAHKSGRLAAPCEPQHDEAAYFRQYNEALIRKLEKKMIQVEEANRRLEREVAERKRAEQALRESEAKFKSLIDNFEDIIFTIDLKGKITFASQSVKEILGYESAETINMNILDFIPQEDRQKAIETLPKGMSGQKITQYQTQAITKSGKRVILELAFSRVYKDGVVVGAQAIAKDITERKRAEEEKSRLASIVESTDDAILSKTLDGVITSWNHGAEKIYRYSAEEIIGQNVAILAPPDLRDEITKILKTVAAGTSIDHLETKRIRKDGKEINVSLTISPVKNQAGKIFGASIIARNITEQKKLQQQLHQAIKMEAVGQLAGGIAHDFNNNLTPILGICGILMKELDKDNALYPDIIEIRDAAERCASLVKQLMAFSRKQVLEPKAVSLNEIVANMEKMLIRTIGEDITLERLYDPELGKIMADPGQIEQIIANLAVNARDAMPQGGKLTIESKNVYMDEEAAKSYLGLKPGNYAMLSIKDTGAGMGKSIQEHIFEPFFTTKKMGKGTGLGLSTVYGIVKQSGGNIQVESDIGKGATFKIFFPIVPDEEKESGSQSALPEAKALGGYETILVVEDEESVRKVVKRVLKNLGYNLLEAANGQEAIKQIDKSGPIHLLVTDVVMPGMSGKDLVDYLLEKNPNLKVLYISGYTDALILNHGALAPGAFFIQKPFVLENLTRKIRQILDNSI